MNHSEKSTTETTLRCQEMKLNIDHYEFDFAKVFSHPVTQELFLQHLKKELNAEIAEFVMTVDAFKNQKTENTDHDILLGKCMAIYDSFVKEGSIKEINVPRKLREETYDAIIQGKYDTAFTKAYDHVSLILKIDIFSRFKRDKSFIEFIKGCDEKMVRQIGTHKSEIQQVLLTPEDFQQPFITPQDILLARLVLKDYYHWRMIYASKKWHSHKIYLSDMDFVNEEAKKIVGHLDAIKVTGTINESTTEYLKAITSKEYCHLLDSSWELLDFIPASEQGYASCILRNIVPVPLGKKREYIMTGAIIRQPGMLIRIYRTCTLEKYQPKHENPKEFIKGFVIVVEVLQELDKNQLKQIAVVLNNSGGWLTPSQSPMMKLLKPLLVDKAVVNALKNNWKATAAIVKAYKNKPSEKVELTDYISAKKSLEDNAKKVGSKIIIAPETLS